MSNPHNTIEVDSYLPTGGRALIRPDPRSDKTQGGILLPGGGSHGPVRVGTMIDQGVGRWENGSFGPLPIPDFESRDTECRVMYFEARLTPVRVWTGDMEEVGDPDWRPPEAPTILDAGWKPKEGQDEEQRPEISDPDWVEPERPSISVKVYEELQVIPHPAILGEVVVDDVPDDLPEHDRVPEGSLKAAPELARPSARLTAAINKREIPRGTIIEP